MKIRKVRIKNFRKISDVSAEFTDDLTVIVGPNGMGKTSIFEAIRLCKSVLMPRTPDEVQQVLVSLGVASPNILFGEFQYDFSSLAGDVTIPLEVLIDLEISNDELTRLRAAVPRVAESIVAASQGQSNPQSRFAMIQYLSSEEGRTHLSRAQDGVVSRLAAIEQSRRLELHLVVTVDTIRGQNQIDQALAASLEAQILPARALFTYFPADRAMPPGEVNVQLHSGDMKAHVDSHFANAATKYPRLKQVIVNQLITNGKAALEKEFDLIFDNLLPGKKFLGIQQKAIGSISVRIQDIESKGEFDIDSLSSGEKGLILTYLLLRTSLATGGVALIDEPELHLNPAVCKKLVGFLTEHVCIPLSAQVVLCTHSPEILTRAFEDAGLALFELVSPRALNPLLVGDRNVMFDALRRLGVPPADSLVYRGFVFVEGEDDVRLFEKGFSNTLQGMKLVQKQGRIEVEKQIQILKAAEAAGKVDKIHLFIFDNDRKPVSHESTKFIRVVQLQRYCIENYLLDDRSLFEFITKSASTPPANRAELTSAIQECSLNQLKVEIAARLYGELQDLSCGMRRSKVRGKSFDQIAATLVEQLQNVKSKLVGLDLVGWNREFQEQCLQIETKEKASWERDHLVLASGKAILEDLQKRYEINSSLSNLKLNVIEAMEKSRTKSWKEINSVLEKALRSQ